MNYLKKFGSFNETIEESLELSKLESVSRMPEQINREEFYKKLETFDKIPFSKKEVEFFNKFVEKNEGKVRNNNNVPLLDKSFDIFTRYGKILSNIHIIKLDDDWYLITEYYLSSVVYRYICDEWEEVIGYLSACCYDYNLKD